MDPLTIIVTALVAGAALAVKDTTAQAIKDGYACLRALVQRKWGGKEDVVAALAQVEQKPESESRRGVLREELTAAGAAQDAETLRLAQALLELLKQHGHEPGISYNARLNGDGAIAQGAGAVAAGAGGVAVGGNVQGATIITGHGNVIGDKSHSDVRITRKDK